MAHIDPNEVDVPEDPSDSKWPTADQWKAMLWTAIKTFIATFIATILVMGKDIFSAGFDDYKVAAVPAVAAVLKVVMNFFNSNDSRYGRGA